jgi:hypothetical protein
MDRPVIRPASVVIDDRSVGTPAGAKKEGPPASPLQKRRVRPGWRATLVRAESFAKLRDIQKSTTDPAIDLSYLTDACLQLALEMGADAIVRRAVAGLRPLRNP